MTPLCFDKSSKKVKSAGIFGVYGDSMRLDQELESFDDELDAAFIARYQTVRSTVAMDEEYFGVDTDYEDFEVGYYGDLDGE